MMTRAALRLCLSCLCLMSLAGIAYGQVDTTRSYCFGDSLTDNEYAYAFFPDLPLDPAIYGADPFEAVFKKAASQTDQLENFAIVGSTSADVLTVVEAYAEARAAGALQPATIVSLQAGGNDFLSLANLAVLGSAPPGESAAADQIVDEIRNNLMSALTQLRTLDKPQIVLWTVPDVTLTPYVLSLELDATATANIRMHLERVNQFLRAQGNRPDIAILDTAWLLTEVTFAPPIILGVELVPTPYFGFPAAIFADPIHPTAVGNGLLANEMIAQLNATFEDSIPFYSEAELAELAEID